MRRVWWAPVALAVASSCWGISVPLSKKAVDVVPPATLLSLQLLVSIIVLWTCILLRRQPALETSPPITRRNLYHACLSGVLQPGTTFLLVTVGLLLTSANEVALLDAIEPIIIMAMAAVLLKERISTIQYVCALSALLGAVLVMLPQVDVAAVSLRGLIGDLLVLTGLFIAALYVILSRRLISSYDGLHLAAVQQSAAWVFSLVALFAAYLFGIQPIPITAMTGEIILVVILSGLLQFALPFWLYLLALRHIRASVTALFLPLIPLSGVITAYFLLDETLTAGQWFGALLIILAVLGSSLLSKGSSQ